MSTYTENASTGAIASRGFIRLLGLAMLAALLTGCVYRMTIQQGNFLEASKVDQLQVGMTRSQVRYLLGTPMVPEAFDNDRWDYVYYMKRGRIDKPFRRHLTVYFENDKVARVDRHGEAPAAAEAKKDVPAESDIAAEANSAS